MKFTVLGEIVERVKAKLSEDKREWPIDDVKRRIRDAQPVRSFYNSLSGPFGLIAEIKKCSPSQGPMRHRDINEVARIYEDHSFVRAVSVLTNRDDFDMSIQALASVRKLIEKPILRKDFIFDEYQVYEARAAGADAVLLMANIVDDLHLRRGLFDLATHLGMDVLFECRDEKEIASIPYGAKIYGINSRKMKARTFLGISRYSYARALSRISIPDKSIQYPVFELARHIPKSAIKIAESGLVPSEIGRIRDEYRYNAALVGTAILNAQQGVKAALDAFSSPVQEWRNAPLSEPVHSR